LRLSSIVDIYICIYVCIYIYTYIYGGVGVHMLSDEEVRELLASIVDR